MRTSRWRIAASFYRIPNPVSPQGPRYTGGGRLVRETNNGSGFVSHTALILFAHGSRVESANDSVRAAARELAQLGSFRHVQAAFLELGQPDLPGAVSMLAGQGVRRIVVIPYFLTLGLHMERDLPKLIAGIQQVHPGLHIRVAPPLEGHPGLLNVLLERAHEALID